MYEPSPVLRAMEQTPTFICCSMLHVKNRNWFVTHLCGRNCEAKLSEGPPVGTGLLYNTFRRLSHTLTDFRNSVQTEHTGWSALSSAHPVSAWVSSGGFSLIGTSSFHASYWSESAFPGQTFPKESGGEPNVQKISCVAV